VVGKIGSDHTLCSQSSHTVITDGVMSQCGGRSGDTAVALLRLIGDYETVTFRSALLMGW